MSRLEEWLQTVGDITGRPGLFVIEPEIKEITRFPARFILPYVQTWGLHDHAELDSSNPFYRSVVEMSSAYIQTAKPHLGTDVKSVIVNEDWGEVRVAVDPSTNDIFLVEAQVIIDKARERLEAIPVVLYKDLPPKSGFCWLDPDAGEYARFVDGSFSSLTDLGSVGTTNREKARELIPARGAAREEALKVFRQAAAVAKAYCVSKGLEPTLVHVFSKRGLYLRFKDNIDQRVVEGIEKTKDFRDAVEEGRRYSTRVDQIENDLRDLAWTLATLYLNHREGVVHVRTAFPPKQRIPLAIGPPAYAVMESLLNKRGAYLWVATVCQSSSGITAVNEPHWIDIDPVGTAGQHRHQDYPFIVAGRHAELLGFYPAEEGPPRIQAFDESATVRFHEDSLVGR
jgi:hypothetical protein